MPKLSIITINLNNLEGLRKTMQSVFEQTFTDYEYIIIDGGSTDGSKEYIEQHADKLSYWVSEKDEGIYNAMNKGINRANGNYLIFLNSGDYFNSRESLSLVSPSDDKFDLISGNMILDKENGIVRKTYPEEVDFEYFYAGNTLPHHSTLIKRDLFLRVGLYNESLKLLSDREFFMNAICLHKASYKYVPVDVAVFAYDGFSSQPGNSHLYSDEANLILDKHYYPFLSLLKRVKEQQNKIRSFENSRLHQFAQKIIQSKLYKFLRGNLKL